VNAANSVDAQAAYESQMSIWACLMGGVNLVYHSAGWLEGGLTASFEKVIVDAEMLQMAAEVLQPIEVSEDTMALEAVKDVGIGGHFFGTAHTLARYEEAFYAPLISDWRNFETWEEAGSPSATQHANRVWKQLLAEYEPPAIGDSVREALDAFVAKRKSEIDPNAL
jgi:trimethylamine--corrinoid protein Co-methyltransferase